MDYYFSFESNISSLQFNVFTNDVVGSESSISLITSEGESGFIYKPGQDIPVALLSNTTVVAIRVRDTDDKESSHMIAFTKNVKPILKLVSI